MVELTYRGQSKNKHCDEACEAAFHNAADRDSEQASADRDEHCDGPIGVAKVALP
jgi:hypothetical protein